MLVPKKSMEGEGDSGVILLKASRVTQQQLAGIGWVCPKTGLKEAA